MCAADPQCKVAVYIPNYPGEPGISACSMKSGCAKPQACASPAPRARASPMQPRLCVMPVDTLCQWQWQWQCACSVCVWGSFSSSTAYAHAPWHGRMHAPARAARAACAAVCRAPLFGFCCQWLLLLGARNKSRPLRARAVGTPAKLPQLLARGTAHGSRAARTPAVAHRAAWGQITGMGCVQ